MVSTYGDARRLMGLTSGVTHSPSGVSAPGAPSLVTAAMASSMINVVLQCSSRFDDRQPFFGACARARALSRWSILARMCARNAYVPAATHVRVYRHDTNLDWLYYAFARSPHDRPP